MRRQVLKTTLLQLVQAVQDETMSDEEVVSVISALLMSGRIRLSGTFSDPQYVWGTPEESTPNALGDLFLTERGH